MLHCKIGAHRASFSKRCLQLNMRCISFIVDLEAHINDLFKGVFLFNWRYIFSSLATFGILRDDCRM